LPALRSPNTEAITVELIETNGTAVVILRWPSKPSVIATAAVRLAPVDLAAVL